MTPRIANRVRLRTLVVALPYLVAAFGFPAVELARTSEAPPAELIASFNDDAFFYFEIARNLAEGRGSTFDGIARTNGYHPLWMALLVPVYTFDLDSYQALVGVTWLASALWFLAIAGFYKIARTLEATAWFAPGLILLSYQKDLWFSGMETGLLLTIFIGVVWKTVKEGAFTVDRPRLVGLGCWLALLPMARLDAVFLVAAYALVFLLRSPGTLREKVSKTALLVTPAAVLLGLFMISSSFLFDTVTPVSGRAKALGGPFINFGVVGDFLLSKPLAAPGLKLLNTGGLLALLVVPAWLFLIFGNRWIRPAWPRGRLLKSILGVLLIAQCSQLLYYAVASSWPLWGWYHYYVPLLLAFSLPVCVRITIRPLTQRRTVVLLLSVLVALGMVIRQHRTLEYSRSREVTGDANYRAASVTVANWLNENTPPESVLAMGDRAGSLGYQLDRSLIHTEGLVNSVEFLEVLEAGEVHGFLQARDVTYLVYSGGELSGGLPRRLAAPAGCAELVEPKFGRGPSFSTVVCDPDLEFSMSLEADDATGGGYWVWRYRHDLNPL